MLRQACRLIPFERSISPGVQISAELVWRRDGWLELSYGILARAAKGIDVLKLPVGLNDGPQQGQRKDELWTTTCFEAFISAPGEQRYWEVNLAANGDWAVYRFDGYRSGQTRRRHGGGQACRRNGSGQARTTTRGRAGARAGTTAQ